MSLSCPHKVQTLELLSPARDLEAAKAAVLAGADAVYTAGPGFSARAKAANSLEDLEEIIKFCHLFKVRVHVTLNILLEDDEFPLVQDLIYKLEAIGTDALIIQDLGIITLDIPKGLELHASTQCNTDTAEKLKFLQDLGFAQAVLPREFSLETIKAFNEAVPEIKKEVFVAGALCVGRSGICYISEYLTGRSGNRGECAQLCRVKMQLEHEGNEIASGHLLNLKDNLALDYLEELIAAGVTSFKIEGRMKDPAYVKNQTAAFRRRLDGIIKASGGRLQRASLGAESIAFTPDLKKTFNRGFTHDYLLGRNDHLANKLSPKFMGEYAGTVTDVREGMRTSTVIIKSAIKLNNGDALSFIDYEGEEQGFRVSEVREDRGGRLRLGVRGHPEIYEGVRLYRNYDLKFVQEVEKADSAKRVLEINESLTVTEQESGHLKLTLAVSDQAGRCALEHLEVDKASEAVTSEETVRAKLFKAQSPFLRVSEVKVAPKITQAVLTLSALNDLRRRAQSAFIETAQKRCPGAGFRKPSKLPLYPAARIDPRLLLSERSARFITSLGFTPEIKVSSLEFKSLMTTRLCLVKEYARCFKEGGSTRGFVLKLGGMSFPIFCDCKHCQMHILEPES